MCDRDFGGEHASGALPHELPEELFCVGLHVVPEFGVLRLGAAHRNRCASREVFARLIEPLACAADASFDASGFLEDWCQKVRAEDTGERFVDDRVLGQSNHRGATGFGRVPPRGCSCGPSALARTTARSRGLRFPGVGR